MRKVILCGNEARKRWLKKYLPFEMIGPGPFEEEAIEAMKLLWDNLWIPMAYIQSAVLHRFVALLRYAKLDHVSVLEQTTVITGIPCTPISEATEGAYHSGILGWGSKNNELQLQMVSPYLGLLRAYLTVSNTSPYPFPETGLLAQAGLLTEQGMLKSFHHLPENENPYYRARDILLNEGLPQLAKRYRALYVSNPILARVGLHPDEISIEGTLVDEYWVQYVDAEPSSPPPEPQIATPIPVNTGEIIALAKDIMMMNKIKAQVALRGNTVLNVQVACDQINREYGAVDTIAVGADVAARIEKGSLPSLAGSGKTTYREADVMATEKGVVVLVHNDELKDLAIFTPNAPNLAKAAA